MMAMPLAVTVRVQKNAIIKGIRTTERAPEEMMVMPSRSLSDFLVADRTDAVLLTPEVINLTSPLQRLGHVA
jgi:hypothetical protein